MLLKRFIALAGCVLLFIIYFTVRSEVRNAQLEDRFRQVRVANNAEGTVLTAPESGPSTIYASPNVTPVSTHPASSVTPMPAPEIVPPAPSSSAATNLLIGPLPPSDTGTPDSTPAAPATPDSNAAPAPMPSSTRYVPSGQPFIMLAAYHPGDDMRIQMQGEPAVPSTGSTPLTAPPPVTAPASNAAPAPASTNEAPVAPSAPTTGAVHPPAVEASVIVLGYHQFVGPGVSSKNPYVMRQDVFEGEMKYLKDNGYHVVPLSDVVKFVKHEIGLPPGSVAITIDDGYKSSIVWAAPVLKKYGYPWTYFVYPQFITVNEGVGAASWRDLLELQAEGVDVESHSMTHPQLTKRGGKTPEQYDAWLTNETAGAKALLEQKLGKPVPYFAYPYGAYNKEVEAKAIAAGYDAIFTVADNPVHSTTNIHSIGRYIITQPVEKAFAGYLRQGALGLSEANPAPGTTTSEPRPVITATLGYAGTLDPSGIETSVRDFGDVKHDFDPKTNTVRLYLPRDLVQPVVLVNIRVKDAASGQVMVANWHFNYEPAGGAAVTHQPIGATTNAVPAPKTVAPAKTNAPAPTTPALSPH